MEICCEPVTAVIPWELLIEILSCLPVKSLMRFKCVCKSWKSLVSDDKAFAKLQLERRSPKNKQVIFTSRSSDRPCFIPCPVPRLIEDPLSIMDQDSCLRFEEDNVIGSCNGLICLQVRGHDDSYERCFQLYNPATRLRFDKSPSVGQVSFTFSGPYFGFGYDVSSDIYKVVVLVYSFRHHRLGTTRIHSIGHSCWRNILSFPYNPIEFCQSHGLFVGGCVNWLVRYKFSLVILSLDMREETYQLLSVPEGTTKVPYGETQIQVLGDCLCLFYDHKRTHFVAWKMTQYGVQESWTPLVSISYEHLLCDHRFQFHLICSCGDGDMLLAKKGKLVIIYNLSDNSVKYVQLPDNKLWLSVYVESLVSP